MTSSHARRIKAPHRRFLSSLGPGLITGASDDDPSGIGTYSQVGAQFGYGMSWVMLFSYPLMCAIQEISARIGRVTGAGIAGNIRRHHSAWLLYPIVALLLVANTINLGADLGAMGDVVRMLVGGPPHLYVALFGVFCVLLQIYVQYARYVSILKWSTLSLFAYVGTALVVGVDWGEVARHTVLRPSPSTLVTSRPSSRSWARPSALICSSGSPLRRPRTSASILGRTRSSQRPRRRRRR